MKKSFNTQITAAHPIVNNHAVYNQRILPGLAYIDMVFQLGQAAMGLDAKKHTLHRISIHNPLVVGEAGHVALRIGFEPMNRGFKVTVEGTEVGPNGASQQEKLYMTAELLEETRELSLRVAVEDFKRTAASRVDLEAVYQNARQRGLLHQGVMKASGALYRTDRAYLVETRVDDLYRDLSQTMMFHPTIIDSVAVAMGFNEESLEGAGEQDLFIPLYFESFHAQAPLGTAGYAFIDKTTFRRVNDILTVDIAYLDAQGNQVALLKGVTSKRVRFKEQINAAASAPAPAAPAAPAPAAAPASANAGSAARATSPRELETQVRAVFGKYLQLEPSGIDVDTGFYELGLESSQLLSLVRDLEQVSGASLQPTLLFEYTTIAELCSYLQSVMPQGQAPQAAYAAQAEVAVSSDLTSAYSYEAPQAAQPQGRSGIEDIAVIGMAGRFPHADNLQEFWTNLVDGKDCITEIPISRWDWKEYENVASPTGKKVSKWGGFLNNPDFFDPQFFRISPREAEVMDPQERLFLETCWEAMEDAGYTPKTLVPPKGPNQRRPVGVFVGAMHKDYAMIGSEAFAQGQLFTLSLQNAPIANRVSYFCNFHGPSMAIDTLCSSSLTALHLALESIYNGESEVAIAGGVNLCLHPHKYLSYGMMDFFSSDGYCHTFGKGGDGYVPGEGVGAVILKPLSKAVRDGDSIYAVIKGSTVNHGGTVSGITVPSPVAHAELITECFEKTQVDPRTITYVEAHGTGTSLGDPIEIDGLVKSYRPHTQDLQYCAIGSVKSNIGHAESAAGISGLMKTILQLHHKTLVPSLHSEEINPLIDFARTPFYVQHKTEPWKQPELLEHGTVVQVPRRAAVSSFGATGSNAHVILEEYVPQASAQPSVAHQPAIIPLSAKSGEQLTEVVERLLQHLQQATGQTAAPAAVEPPAENHGLRLELAGKLRALVSEVLNVEQDDIDANQEWSEFGIDLVQLAMISDRLQEEYNGQIELDLHADSSIASVVDSLAHTQQPTSAPASRSLSAVEWKQGEINLHELAYTLQVGREAMEERLVLIVESLPELVQKLEKYLANPAAFKDGFRGQEKRNKDVVDVLSRDEDSMDLIRKWIAKGKLSSLADLWVKGYQMDWNLLYGQGQKPRRVHLPTYPFAKERYWIEVDAKQKATVAGKKVSVVLHPLLHQNTSDLIEQRFTSVFSGEEFFLTDHVVNGQRILPGVAHLEMARAAAELASGGNTGVAWKLDNVVWIRPLVCAGEETEVHIRLYPEAGGEIAYEIYTGTDEQDEVVYSQGRAVATPMLSPRLDVAHLQAECSQGSLTADQCYQTFSKMGMEYGPGHRGIQVVYTGADKALAKLSLPFSIHSTKHAYTLNPGLLDSALQATIGVTLGADVSALSNLKPTLPFALQEIVTYAPVPAESWVSLRFSPGVKRGDSVLKYDLDLCNEQGEICVSIKGFTMRVLDGAPKAAGAAKAGNPLVGALTLYPIWNQIAEAKAQQLPSAQDQVAVIGGSAEQVSAIRALYPQAHHLAFSAHDDINSMVSRFQSLPSLDHIVWIAPEPLSAAPSDDALIQGQAAGFYQLFRVIKAVLQLGYGKKKLGWSVWTSKTQRVLPTDAINAEHSGIYGLTGSMAKEYTNWSIRVADVEDGNHLPLSELFTLPVDRQGRAWAHRNGQWFQQQLIPFENPALNQTAYRQGGVYVVIGGAGSVGEMWTEYMIRTYNARVYWIGRRQQDAAIQAQLDRLAAFGPAPRYIAADAGNFESLQRAYEEIKAAEPQIHGIVHSTMVLLDQGLDLMTEQEMRNVLVSKVDVSVRLAQVFGKEALDFVLFFSSLMAFTKAAKQSSYAAGCTFEDAFAHQLDQVWPCKVKVINWGYWGKGDGGVTDSESHQALAETYARLANIGIGLIEPAEAWDQVERLLAGPAEQTGFMKTTKQIPIEGVNPDERAIVDSDGQIVRLSNRPAPVSAPAVQAESAPKPARGNAAGHLKEKTTTYLKKLVGDTLKMSVNKIDAAEPLEMYGIDSIIIVELTNSLRDVFGEIPSTLFFECQTIEELAEYFLKSQKDALTAMFGSDSTSEAADAGSAPQQAVLQTPAAQTTSRKKARRFAALEAEAATASAKSSSIMDIAVIGLSGRYPQAKNVDEFWAKLASGTNCISEIPADRWDWKKYFNPERGREGSIYTKWGGFLSEIDSFDPLFFNITPREAKTMDPQERLFLEVAYSSIEDAGYTPATLNDRKRVGVFVGVMNSNYPSGTAYWSIANRLSYLLNFRGPSMAIDTACSSSLTALHLALESLYSGTSECAVVGGVNLIVDPFHYIRLTSQNMLSPGNRCNTFGDQADGFVDSEAVGAVLLKPLHKAVEDGDHIYGVIKGSMINSGGKVNGYTVPNPNAQFQLIAEAMQRAGVHARTVSYVEAHGTGTALGDPIEIEGLRQAYELDTTDKQFCAIGSVKSNIGHSESAAGIAGLTKILLQLKHRQLVPSLNSETLNPRIQFANTPFTVQHELVPWERPTVEINGETKEYPRIAGLSSFGAGGSNAHVIIEEYIPDPARVQAAAARQPQVPIVLSAKNEEQLKAQAQRLLDAVRSHAYTDEDLGRIAYTLQVGREAMEDRLGVLVGSLAELEEKLQGYLEQREDVEHVYVGQVKRNKEALLYFTTDEDLMEAVDKWIESRKYPKLLDLWVKGLQLDWNKFYGNAKPQRISLPTYAFAKGKYWLSAAEIEAMAPKTAGADVRPLLPAATSGKRWEKEGTDPNCWNYVLWSGRI